MLSRNVYNYITLATGNLLRNKKCYNGTMPVTTFKYLPFSAGKTAHLERLCLENSLKVRRANVGRLFVCCKNNILRLSKHKCFVTEFVTNNV